MRKLLIALLAGLCASSAHAQGRSTAGDSAKYHEIVQRLQAGDTLVDYTALRFLFVKQPRSADRHPDPGAELRAAEQAPDHEQARRMVEALVGDYYGLMQAHQDAAAVFTARGDSAKARFHQAVVRGMVRSMEAGGRERPDGAMPVISVFEEYAYLRALGLEPHGQALAGDGADHFDLLTALDPKTNQTRHFTFLLTWWHDDEKEVKH